MCKTYKLWHVSNGNGFCPPSGQRTPVNELKKEMSGLHADDRHRFVSWRSRCLRCPYLLHSHGTDLCGNLTPDRSSLGCRAACSALLYQSPACKHTHLHFGHQAGLSSASLHPPTPISSNPHFFLISLNTINPWQFQTSATTCMAHGQDLGHI